MTSLTSRLDHSTLPSRYTHHYVTGLILLVWFCLITLTGYFGLFIPETGQPPVLLLVSGVSSLILFTLAYRYNIAFRDYILQLDMRLLVMLHGFRTLGMGFVMLYSIGMLPAIFALPAGFGDAIAAVWAMIITYHWFTRTNGLERNTLLRWNHFGLLDFILALSLGILSQTNGVLHFDGTPSSDLMVRFPFVLIPGFLVQVFVITHIIIYLQISNHWKNQNTLEFNR